MLNEPYECPQILDGKIHTIPALYSRRLYLLQKQLTEETNTVSRVWLEKEINNLIELGTSPESPGQTPQEIDVFKKLNLLGRKLSNCIDELNEHPDDYWGLYKHVINSLKIEAEKIKNHSIWTRSIIDLKAHEFLKIRDSVYALQDYILAIYDVVQAQNWCRQQREKYEIEIYDLLSE